MGSPSQGGLVHHFGDALTFHRPHKQNVCEYVFSSMVQPGPLVENCAVAMATIASTAEEMVDDASQCSLDEMEVSTVRDAYRAAIFIRSEIQSLQNNIPISPRTWLRRLSKSARRSL